MSTKISALITWAVPHTATRNRCLFQNRIVYFGLGHSSPGQILQIDGEFAVIERLIRFALLPEPEQFSTGLFSHQNQPPFIS